MSGGSLNYFYTMLQDHVGDFGDKELDELVADLAELFHDREWYLSADTGRGSWREARDEFKAKWFTEHGRQERIEKYIQEYSNEIRDALGVRQKYCKNCKHWTAQGEDSYYGNCEYEKHCLTHRSDDCEKYEAGEQT